MKTIKISGLSILILLTLNTIGQESASLKRIESNQVVLNWSFGAGTFAAGENMGGSVFLGNSISADWIPNRKSGLSFGLESGLLGGETQGSIVYGIPAVFRLGWHPGFMKKENIDLFVLMKAGWAFGIWGTQLETGSNPNGIVGGFNFGGRYVLTPRLGLYAELGYTYYGLARSSNHPEYPLGYGSGKLYTSLGLSLKIEKQSLLSGKKNKPG
jgi:hypothetical protein